MQRRVYVLLALGALGIGLAVPACSDESGSTTTVDPCPNGICGTTTSTGATMSTGSGQGGSGGQMGTGGNTGCVEIWECTPWVTDGTNNNGTRTCTDKNACGTTKTKPVEAATLPALDIDYYKCNVEPILDRGCAQLACHGTEQGRALRTYARGRLRITGETWIEPGCLKQGTPVASEKCIGGIECACWTLPHSANEWQRNFDAARGLGLDPTGTPIPAGMEDTSDLIAQPIVGGKAHAGIHLFKSGDKDHTTLKSWLSGAKLGMACTTTN